MANNHKMGEGSAVKDSIGPVAAGIAVGVAATAAAVALTKKENRQKISKMADEVIKKGEQLGKLTKQRLEEVSQEAHHSVTDVAKKAKKEFKPRMAMQAKTKISSKK